MKTKLTIMVNEIADVPQSTFRIYKDNPKVKALFDERFAARWQESFNKLSNILGLNDCFKVVNAELVEE
jgi:hypothetical protein